jgi:uncharacterized membrane protein
MNMLIAAAIVFLAIHFLVSGTRLRDTIAGAIGEKPYRGLFSLASLAAISWLCWTYNAAQANGSDPVFYDLGHVRDLGIIVVLIAFLIGVPGLTLPNPTAVGGDAAASGPVRGVITITRHPFLWSVTIWSAFHPVSNGDEASIILFGSFFVLALLGTASIDAKRKRKIGPRWDAFAARTSSSPTARRDKQLTSHVDHLPPGHPLRHRDVTDRLQALANDCGGLRSENDAANTAAQSLVGAQVCKSAFSACSIVVSRKPNSVGHNQGSAGRGLI